MKKLYQKYRRIYLCKCKILSNRKGEEKARRERERERERERKREKERRGENKGQKLGRIRGCWAELTIIIKSTVTAHDFHSGPSFHPTMTFLHRASPANRIKTNHRRNFVSAKTMLPNNFLIITIHDINIYIYIYIYIQRDCIFGTSSLIFFA